MVKVLIYGSKEIYDSSSFEGRAEADIIAYRSDEHYYKILKNRTSQHIGKTIVHFTLGKIIERAERDEWQRDKEMHKLKVSYKDHPYTTLMKNETL